jgi:translation initiation factor 2B subunit (eIF-2B alpha/beta/delta family)
MQNVAQRIAVVRDDREHGSRWLVRETLLILRDLARQQAASEDEHLRRLYQSGRELAYARPSMAALASAVGRVLSTEGGVPAIERAAEKLLREYDTATKRITEYARPYLHGQLLTCSLSGTVLDVLIACRQAIERIVVMEGRPRYEGRDLAQALSQQGIAVTLITDAQADIFLPDCQCIVVGADSVLANGDIINKSGTALLAWSGRGHHCPLYVLCESLKIAPYKWKGEALLEEKEPEEVLAQPIPGVQVRNFYFDRTLARLVSGVITEQGLLNRSQIRRIAAETRRNAKLLARL